MSREIKFRAWSISQNEMLQNIGVHPHLMMDLAGDDDYYKENKDGRFLVCPTFTNYKIMQYTGLKDKNGKEIYEGDIVTCKTIQNNVENKGYIFWMAGGLWGVQTDEYTNSSSNYQRTSNVFNNKDFEVIGNIYENTETNTGGEGFKTCT